MSYLAMYRRWRPERFADVVGQPHIVRTLQNALKMNRFTHAYLFAGPRGTGKTSVARLFARAVNCEKGPAVEPCNECTVCKTMLSGQSLDLLEIDAASNRGIDEIRELREKVTYLPAQARYKVYIVDEAHMLTPEAFNALLKTLEEPPQHSIFILATTEPYRIPITILSRCQRFDFRRITLKDTVSHLQNIAGTMEIEVEPRALEMIAMSADGSLRDALSLFEQCATMCPATVRSADVEEMLGVVPTELFLELTRLLLRGDRREAFSRVLDAIESGKEPHQFVQDWIKFCRDLMMLKFGVRATEFANGGEREFVEESRGHEIISLLDGLLEIESQLRWSEQPRVILEVGVLRLIGNRPGAEQDEPRQASPVAASLKSPEGRPAPQGREDAGQASELGLKDVQQAWPRVKAEAIKIHRPLLALLKDARPVSVRGREVVLTVGAELQRKLVEREQNMNVLRIAFRRVIGKEVSLSCCSADKVRDPSPGEAPSAGLPQTDLPTPGADGDIVNVALEMFGGEIIEKRGDIRGGIGEHGENAKAGAETSGRHG